MRLYITLFALLTLASIMQAQNKPIQSTAEELGTTVSKKPLQVNNRFNAVPKAKKALSNTVPVQYNAVKNRPPVSDASLKVSYSEDGMPNFIVGQPKALRTNGSLSISEKCEAYLEALQPVLRLENPASEFEVMSVREDELGQTHVKMQQVYNGVKVYGAEIVLHAKQAAVNLFNGTYYPTPTLENVTPSLNANQALERAKEDLATFTTVKNLTAAEQLLIGNDQDAAELVIYHKDRNHETAFLAWHVTVYPHLMGHYQYFIDAQTGEVIHQFNHVCQIDGGLTPHNCSSHTHDEEVSVPTIAPALVNGPFTANAVDLLGITRQINTYCVGSTFFMEDGSRDMFNQSQSSVPDDPVGMIVTLDANNTSPSSNSFSYDYITSGNNSWNNQKGVSAHYNAGLAYEYFENTFNRNSINGSGGNIISLVNVADQNGQSMDNAFWNGNAMFYGNGAQAFDPLAKALDVAGHEMSHGVVQSTANLEYQGQSGAMNESFADIFGAMIDRNDWRMGEDIVNTSVFPSGALRDLADPHNGGNSLGDAGWQPAHYNERYTGTQDNGGVHINSGIPNKAFYLFATTSGVGKDKAEQVFYRALDQYLTMSSQFVDLRNAVVQSANDLYNATVADAAKNAFNAVGIGEGAGNDYEQDVEINPGDDFLLLSEADASALFIAETSGDFNFEQISTTNHISRPSITDDGTALVFIDATKNMRAIILEWTDTGVNVVDEFNIETEPQSIWRNIAISKDGSKIAYVTEDLENRIWVFDFDTQTETSFDLYNPTTADPNSPSGGISTGDVLYADVLEWDFSGQYVMYDAANRINDNSGGSLEYWDVSFAKVWDNNSSNFDEGDVSKLFTGIPEGISIGNPTFAKNSPYIVSYDYIDQLNNKVYLRAANIETNNVGDILENNTLSYPNYSVADDRMVFNTIAQDNNGNDIDAVAVIPLGANKISANGQAQVWFQGGKWGVWFGIGQRDLEVSNTELVQNDDIKIYPNPFDENLTLEVELDQQEQLTITVYDLLGKEVYTQSRLAGQGMNKEVLPLATLTVGSYIVKTQIGNGVTASKIMKLK